MIKLLRVDHRLIHGQVAFAWTADLDVDCILVASDSVVHDEIRKTTLKLAKPAGCKLVIKSIEDSIAAINSGVTDKYRLFIVVEEVEDAYKLCLGCHSIKQVNLGGTKRKDGGDKISKSVYLIQQEKEMVKKLSQMGIEVEIRQTPTDKKVLAIEAIQ